MQDYQSLVFVCAIVLIGLYVLLGTLAESRAIKFGAPAIVTVLMVAFSVSPWHVVG
ncbi:hypothetical protein P3W85_04945 [Cupriavidus basilensis]|uniref:Uncharacterized protein n=1 Tax=Cupriavidus basilensis TaxID=68895 RepID=A0ABT6AIL4_9BURK|nr:hypothetical protein [Cupriavidus basilensis]MDF3832299.1 hypothetical protein [Cupriavidus basilensis]